MTLDTATEQQLRALARQQGGRSLSSVVREAVAAYLETPPAPRTPQPATKPAR
ncbi:MAG: ribbon-helix-helix protein, CopG family [Luteolibacter sp.]